MAWSLSPRETENQRQPGDGGGELRPLAGEFLLSQRAMSRGFFDPAYVRRMLDQHIRRSQDHASRIWELTVLEAWCRTFLDRENPLAAPLKFK